MQIKIRQRYGIGATLEIAATLADFFISAYSRHKMRFTHPAESKTSMAEAASTQKRPLLPN
jgi:hypothetical protein